MHNTRYSRLSECTCIVLFEMYSSWDIDNYEMFSFVYFQKMEKTGNS